MILTDMVVFSGRYSTVQQELSGRYRTIQQELSGRYTQAQLKTLIILPKLWVLITPSPMVAMPMIMNPSGQASKSSYL